MQPMLEIGALALGGLLGWIMPSFEEALTCRPANYFKEVVDLRHSSSLQISDNPPFSGVDDVSLGFFD